MLRFSIIVAFCLLATHCGAHKKIVKVVEPADCAAAADVELCRDFRDIRNLIDANTLVYYISSGYFQDESFRKAMDFVKTDQFKSVSKQIAESNAYQKLLQRFSNAGINTDSIASIANIFDCLMLSMPKYGDVDYSDSIEMQSLVVPRSLQDVATNLMNAIPRSDFRKLINEKLRNNSEFAKFYRIVRSKSFKREVKKLFATYQLKYPLSVLKRHHIDLVKLAKMANQIFEWGPSY
ncbi:uncharacterized protein LOC118743690 [Rhagoletis pomonella]|uniref:uncharacterized protein LOC118743690 n=1 Tax=Rhagoletis pomonella TaxID=28610 RepID=UPI001785D52D|nr:uncharacterized protein LOC118743690 [Rhagoletis pomonella]